jgi:hypothetical protein
MFVRWKRRITASKKWRKNYNTVRTEEVIGTYANGSPRYQYVTVPKTDDEKTLRISAYLCTSVRIDGEPRQKAVYLANINPKYIEQVAHQAHFWKPALARLDAAQLPTEQRQSIEAALEKRVPRPSDEAIARAEAEAEAFMQYLTSKLKGRV